MTLPAYVTNYSGTKPESECTTCGRRIYQLPHGPWVDAMHISLCAGKPNYQPHEPGYVQTGASLDQQGRTLVTDTEELYRQYMYADGSLTYSEQSADVVNLYTEGGDHVGTLTRHESGGWVDCDPDDVTGDTLVWRDVDAWIDCDD